MKFTTLVLALAFSSAAAAQTPASKTPATATAKPAVVLNTESMTTPAPAALQAQSARETNPFTGKDLTAEQIQMKLERARLETQALEEQLKQVNLQHELQNVPLRKAVEAAQARTGAQKEEMAQKAMQVQAKATAAASNKTAQASPKSKKELEAEERAAKAAAALRASEPAVPARPTLLSVLEVGGSKSVVMDFAGSTLVAADGDMTPVGPVRVMDANTATINGTVYKVRTNTISRFVVSDRDPEARKPGQGSTTPVAGAAPAPGQPAAVAALPPLPSFVGPATTASPGAASPMSVNNLGIPLPR